LIELPEWDLAPGGDESLILTDREIPISLDRRLTTIAPQPEEIAVTASTVDLTLDPLIWIVRDRRLCRKT